jgi:hypothetical protein
MAEIPLDPDEAPKVEVKIFEEGQLVNTSTFSTLEAAEAFAEEWTDRVPGAHAEFEDLAHTHSLYEIVEDSLRCHLV